MTSATCAICLNPIERNQKFVLSYTEVLHRSCALASSLMPDGRTLLTKTKMAAADERAEAERALRAAVEQGKRLEGRLGVLEKSVGDLKQVVRYRDDQRALHERVIREQTERAIRAEADLARARAELEALRAAARTPQGEETIVSSPVDDAALRFSLLELDAV